MHFKKRYKDGTIRLKGRDYSKPGNYFVTIVTKDRTNFFGNIKNKTVCLNSVGSAAHKLWLKIPHHFENVKLDEFIVMPNHVHGIINIVGSCHGMSPPRHNQFSKPVPGSLWMIINHYKGAVTRYCNENNKNFQWQTLYHDRVIRNKGKLERIRKYIKNNSKEH